MFFWSVGRIWYHDLFGSGIPVNFRKLGFLVNENDANSKILSVVTSSSFDKIVIRVKLNQLHTTISWDVQNDLEFEGFQHFSSDLEIIHGQHGDAYVKEDNYLHVIEQGCCLASFDFKHNRPEKKSKEQLNYQEQFNLSQGLRVDEDTTS